MKSLRKKFFKYFAFSVFGVFILNTLASIFFWYSSITEFDMLMHFLGGFTALIFSFWFLYKKNTKWIDAGKKWKPFRVNLLIVLVIALLWEIMEFMVQGFFNTTVLANIPDSFSDIGFGLLGGAVGFIFLFHKYKKRKIINESSNNYE